MGKVVNVGKVDKVPIWGQVGKVSKVGDLSQLTDFGWWGPELGTQIWGLLEGELGIPIWGYGGPQFWDEGYVQICTGYYQVGV